jgi:hypothetical protein
LPTPPPTPAPTPVPLNAPCDAYAVACSQCVDTSMHSASRCRFCDNRCLDTADTAQTCSADAFYNVDPDNIGACPRAAPPIASAWHEVVGVAAGKVNNSAAADYRLRWRHDGTNIQFEISAMTTGWVGVGWSRAEFAKGASHLTMDAYVGSLSDAGVARVINAYSMFNIAERLPDRWAHHGLVCPPARRARRRAAQCRHRRPRHVRLVGSWRRRHCAHADGRAVSRQCGRRERRQLLPRAHHHGSVACQLCESGSNVDQCRCDRRDVIVGCRAEFVICALSCGSSEHCNCSFSFVAFVLKQIEVEG